MAQWQRQGARCYGCLEATTIPVKFNGALLCEDCHKKLDDPQVLRRLMALGDYRADKHNIYLIGSLKNRSIMDLGNAIRQADPQFDVMDEWITPGPEADDHWQEYETLRGRSWPDAMRGRGAQNIFMFDRAYMDHADTIILCLPCGKSAMCELGYAAGRGKNTILFLNGHAPDRYEIMPNFAQHIVHTQTELITLLKELKNV